jgi:hypothetical protein
MTARPADGRDEWGWGDRDGWGGAGAEGNNLKGRCRNGRASRSARESQVRCCSGASRPPRDARQSRSARPGLPACRPGKNPSVGQNATRPPPCMRWRGPCLASPLRSGQLPGLPSAARRPPGPDTRAINRSPGPFSRPRSCPQMVSVSNGESISTPSASCRARVCGHSFQVSSLSTRCPQNEAAYPHLSAVIHRFLHKKSTGDVM